MIQSYCGISDLFFSDIVLEKLLRNEKDAKLNSKQHGFRSGHSTITQLLVYVDELYANFDTNIEQLVVYLDFSKAFDCVNFNILQTTLSLFELDDRFLKLFKSYSFGQTQRVRIDGCLSATVDITSSVPQGSFLGPFYSSCI